MSGTAALESDIDRFQDLIGTLFHKMSYSALTDSRPEVAMQTLLDLDTDIQQNVQLLIERMNTHKRLIELTRQIHANSIRLNGFLNSARALEETIFDTLGQEPRIRDSVSTSALYATSVDIAYHPNMLPLISIESCQAGPLETDVSELSQELRAIKADQNNSNENTMTDVIRQRIEHKANYLLEELQKTPQHPTLATIRRQAATAAETVFPAITGYTSATMPISLTKQPIPDPTLQNNALMTLSPDILVRMIQTKSADLGY